MSSSSARASSLARPWCSNSGDTSECRARSALPVGPGRSRTRRASPSTKISYRARPALSTTSYRSASLEPSRQSRRRPTRPARVLRRVARPDPGLGPGTPVGIEVVTTCSLWYVSARERGGRPWTQASGTDHGGVAGARARAGRGARRHGMDARHRRPPRRPARTTRPPSSPTRTTVVAIPGDVADAAHRDAAGRPRSTELGRLDLLVNNASTLGASPLPALDVDRSRRAPARLRSQRRRAARAHAAAAAGARRRRTARS